MAGEWRTRTQHRVKRIGGLESYRRASGSAEGTYVWLELLGLTTVVSVLQCIERGSFPTDPFSLLIYSIGNELFILAPICV